MLHVGQEERVDILDCNHIVDIALLNSERSFGIGYLGRAGRDKNNADLFRLQSGFLHCPGAGNLRCYLDRSLNWKQPGDKGGEFYADQPYDRGTG